jgi:hypothetical protein
MKSTEVELEAKELAFRLARAMAGDAEVEGTWTMSIYDTAWISMIQKPDGTWLFPESFEYILRHQLNQSGWPSYASHIDGILNTSAAVLAIAVRLEGDKTLSPQRRQDLLVRQLNGQTYLQQCLIEWDTASCLHVGFEIIVPALLTRLEEYHVHLNFPNYDILRKLNALKLAKFEQKSLYGPLQTTALHSLEAFIGTVDFNKLRHHKVRGSMLGSPSSTAAYLMNVRDWDEEAECYLRRCVQHGGGLGHGGVPSAYPSEIFEFTWVSCFLSSLYEGTFV